MPLNIVPPVAGLPEGPATEARVRKQLSLKDDDNLDNDALEHAINAANLTSVGFRYVDQWVQAALDTVPVPAAWPHDIALGVTMLAARLFKRRNSTEGVASFGADGAVYIQRNDPDIALLLKLGTNAGPAVG